MKDFLIKMKGWLLGKDRMPRAAITALVIAIVAVLNVIVYSLTTSLNWYFYADSTKDVTVSDAPAAAFADAIRDGNKLTVVFCQPREKVEASTTGRYVLKTAELLEEKLADFLEVKFENIIVDPDLLTEKYGFSEDDVKDAVLSRSSVVFIGEDAVGNKQFRALTDTSTSAGYVDFYDYDASGGTLSAYIGEEVMTAMGLWVLTNDHPRALLTTYHGETVTKSLTLALAESGYTVETVDLRKNVDFENVGILIISNPQSDFEQAAQNADIQGEIDRLGDYLEDGGLVYIALDSYSQAKMPVLQGLMRDYGIERKTETTEDGSKVLQIVKDRENGITTDGFSIVGKLVTDGVAEKIAEKVLASGDGKILTANSSVLSLSKNAEPLLVSSASSVAEADGKTVDREGSYPLVAYAEKTYGNEKGRLVVSGSIYLTASDAMVSDGYANRDFFFALFDVLGGREGGFPYGCKPMMLSDMTLTGLTMKTARAVTVCLLFIPIVIGVLGCFVVVRRKNR